MLITAGVSLSLGIIFSAIGIAVTKGKQVRMFFKDGIRIVRDTELIQMEKTTIDSFKNIAIDVDAADIMLIENDTDEFALEYKFETPSEDMQIIGVEDDTFKVTTNYEIFHFVLNFGGIFGVGNNDYYIKLYYPKGTEFDQIKLESDAGDIFIEDTMVCNSLSIDTSAGKSVLKNVTGDMKVNMSAGSFTADNCNFGHCDFNMSAGSVTLTNCVIDGGKFDMSAGGFKADQLTLTKSLDLDMSAGSVKIVFVDGQEIGYDFDMSAGSAKINGEKRGSEYQDKKGYDIILTIDSSAGSVDITNK